MNSEGLYSTLRSQRCGEIVSIESGIVRLKYEEGREVFVAIDKIAAFTECSDQSSRPGFIV